MGDKDKRLHQKVEIVHLLVQFTLNWTLHSAHFNEFEPSCRGVHVVAVQTLTTKCDRGHIQILIGWYLVTPLG